MVGLDGFLKHLPSPSLPRGGPHFLKRYPQNRSITFRVEEMSVTNLDYVMLYLVFNWYSGGWSSVGSTRHCGYR
jgi:hypothetical protein